MRTTYLRGLATLSIAVIYLPGVAAATPLYTTGFERPTFVPGSLVGQDGWHAFEDRSVDAATVSTELPRSGDQSVRIEGPRLEQSPSLGIYGGFYRQDLNYDPIADCRLIRGHKRVRYRCGVRHGASS